MANDKEIIKKLLAIATKQQKIITKLAQDSAGKMPPAPGAPVSTAPPPDKLEPAKTQKTPAKALWDAMSPQLRGTLAVPPEAHGNDMMVKFKPGQGTQANYDGIMKVLQDLTNKNVIQSAYNLKLVQ